MATNHNRSGPISFQPPHWSQPGLQPPVVTLDPVVGILLRLLRIVGCPRELFFDHRFLGLGEIGYDFNWFVVSKQGGLEEGTCGRDIAAFGNVDVDYLAVLVDCSVDVSPGA